MSYFASNIVSSMVEDKYHYIFDLNGLILDDEPIQLEATNAAFASVGLNLNQSTWIDRCVGHKPLEYLPEFLRGENQEELSNDFILNLLVQKDLIYKHMLGKSGNSLVREGILEFMHYLKNEKKIISICTSTTREGVDAVLNNIDLGLAEFVDNVVCGDEVEHSKPHPEIYLKAIAKTGISPMQSISFEDTNVGMLSAIAAGLECVACPNSYTKNQNFSRALLVLSDFSSLASPLDLSMSSK